MREDILLCIDVSPEMGQPWNDVSTESRLDSIKSVIGFFVKHKHGFDPRHRFGICAFGDDASLLLDFTNDSELVLGMVGSLIAGRSSPSFDFSRLFNKMQEWFGPRLGSSSPEEDSSIRALVVYGRSYAMPSLSIPYPGLLDHPRCFFDVLYAHKKQSKGNPESLVCQEAFDFLMDNFEGPSKSKTEYVLEVSGSTARLSQHMAMLLAHPALREDQDTFLDKLEHDAPFPST